MSSQPSITIGADIGDRYSHLCLLDTETGDVVKESRIATAPAAFERRFVGSAPARIAIEAGTHSPWISRLLEERGHQVLVTPRGCSTASRSPSFYSRSSSLCWNSLSGRKGF